MAVHNLEILVNIYFYLHIFVTNRLFRNVGKYHSTLSNIPEQ
jgi:hypothetical protein